MEIHQVLVSASPGDAVTNYAFQLRALLRRAVPSDVFARYVDPRLASEVPTLDRYVRRARRRQEGNVLLFHASIGEPSVLSFINERPERVVLVYHNISPADAYRAHDPAFAGLLDSGRQELASLRDRVTMALAVSSYNARELEALGYADVRVVPLVVDTERLHAVEPDPGTARHLVRAVRGPVFLFVGQLLPHKRPDLLVKAYHALVTHLVPEAHLVLVGAGRLPRYRQALQLFVQELNLANAWLTGPVSDEELVAFYRRADVFVTASEHEGFCVPLLEAMGFGVPVVARAFAAVPDTLADAGLLLPPEESPLLLAEAMAELARDEALRAELRERGARRLRDFDPDAARAAVLEHLLEVA